MMKRYMRLSAILILIVAAGMAQATTKYVTPTGAGAADGSDWDNAFSNIQAAINACPASGDEVRLRYGSYSNSSQLVVSNHPGLTIRGGYEGVGSPGDFTNVPTILTRMITVSNRIFYAVSSTVTVDRLSFTNGLESSTTVDVYGAGLFLTNCNTLVTNCVIEGNSLPSVIRPAGKNHNGSGICAITGALTVANSRIRNNGHSTYVYVFNNLGNRFGDGLFAKNAAVVLADTTFEYNSSGIRDGLYGAGLYLVGGSAQISRCDFNTNSFFIYGWTGNGAALYADTVKPLIITNCAFRATRYRPCHTGKAARYTLADAMRSPFRIACFRGRMCGPYRVLPAAV